jgi:hypothetical protein
MKGSIRFFAGLILTMGSAGGIENSVTSSELFSAVAIGVLGLAIMFSGVKALKQADVA